MWNFLLSGPDIDHKHIVAHPEAHDVLASIFVEYTGGRKDLVFGDVVWLSHYRFVYVPVYHNSEISLARRPNIRRVQWNHRSRLFT